MKIKSPARMFRSISLGIPVAAAISLSAIAPANAFTSLFTIADYVVKQEAKKAFADKQHVAWCQQQAPGFRANWNNWRTPNGRVKYCKSPYFTPVWMTPYKG